jgi:DNA polymerase-3 subunit delta
MTAIKPQAFGSAFKAGSSRFIGALVFGQNWELLSRLKSQAIRDFSGSFPDGEVVRFSDSDLTADSGRLLEELQAISMFGNEKLIVVDASSAAVHKACIGAISIGWSNCSLLVTAGDLKKSSPLRKEFEASPDLAAVICYDQDRSELVVFARDRLLEANVTAPPDVLQFIVDAVEGNAALLESELQKVIAYLGGATKLTYADAREVVVDNEAASMDGIIDAVFSANAEAAIRAVSIVKSQGQNPSSVLIALTNHCALLLELAALVDQGKRPGTAVKEWRPPIFFKKQAAIMRQLEIFDCRLLQTVSERLRTANADVRTKPEIAWGIAERFAISTAGLGRRMR